MKVSTTHLNIRNFGISYVISELLYESNTEKFHYKVREYNMMLKSQALEAGMKTCKQVSVRGSELLVDDLDL